MDQELLEEIQNIKGFSTSMVWAVNKIGRGGFRTKRYTRKQDAINRVKSAIGKKMYILVTVNSITGTTYEWI